MDWRKVPKSIKASLRERILINFDVDLSSKIVVEIIDFQMGRSFKNHRAKLLEHFLRCNGEEDMERAKGMKPTDSNITNDAWHILCDYWSSEKFQAMSRKNSENRGKRKYVSENRSDSTSSRHCTGTSGRLSHTEMSVRLASTESELSSTKSELASTKSELVLMKDEMAELRQMVRTFISGQPLPSFSSSLYVQDNGYETQDR